MADIAALSSLGALSQSFDNPILGRAFFAALIWAGWTILCKYLCGNDMLLALQWEATFVLGGVLSSMLLFIPVVGMIPCALLGLFS